MRNFINPNKPTTNEKHLKSTQNEQNPKPTSIIKMAAAMRSAITTAYNRAHFESNMIRPLVPCPTEWLPEETAYLARRPLGLKKVWFPEDVNGEPHESNPDDGCGGAKYKLNTVHFYDADKKDLLAADHEATAVAFREALSCFHSLYEDIDYTWDNLSSDKLAIWIDFQQKTDALREPDYGSIGALWATIFRGDPRLEED
tara:strand:+ start:846 stop:1445 length:600 start_codon:yes stop_codon:yes gene_type:complete